MECCKRHIIIDAMPGIKFGEKSVCYFCLAAQKRTAYLVYYGKLISYYSKEAIC